MTVLIFSELVGLVKEAFFEEGLNFKRVVFFSESQDHSFAFLVTYNEGDCLLVCEYSLNFVESFEVSNKLILSVQNLHKIFIRALFALFIFFFKSNNY